MSIVYASKYPVDKVILVDAAGVKPKRPLKYYLRVYSFKLMKALAPIFMGRQRGLRSSLMSRGLNADRRITTILHR